MSNVALVANQSPNTKITLKMNRFSSRQLIAALEKSLVNYESLVNDLVLVYGLDNAIVQLMVDNNKDLRVQIDELALQTTTQYGATVLLQTTKGLMMLCSDELIIAMNEGVELPDNLTHYLVRLAAINNSRSK